MTQLATLASDACAALVCGDPGLTLDEVVIDSRAVLGPSALFVALSGPRFDGHAYLSQARARGAQAALVSDIQAARDAGFDAILAVTDTRGALQSLARAARARFDGPVVGITGSNGKTLVKELLGAILAREHTVHRSPGSYNSQIGVALSLLALRPEHDVALIEAGISEVGEMARLAAMIRPSAGVLTNIGAAHAAGLATPQITAREKALLFEGADWVVCSGHDEDARYALSALSAGAPSRITWWVCDGDGDEGAPDGASLVVHSATHDGARWRFKIRRADAPPLTLQLSAPQARYALHNAAAAILTAWRLGASDAAIIEGVAAWEPAPMRLELHTTPRGITLIHDAYSSDPVSARAALQALMHHAGAQRKIAILGDMLDLGARAEVEHRALGALIATQPVAMLICVGEAAAWIGEAARAAGLDPARCVAVPHIDALHELLEEVLRPGDVVLFKGSGALGLDRAAARLLESVGPTRLTIDLSAIAQNYHALRHSLGGHTPIMAVVKSAGYGNDATRVAMTLAREGVAALAVAYPDEAIPLRQAGLTLPIIVQNALIEEADKLCRHDLTPLVYTRPVVEALARQAHLMGRVVSVHLEIDTGMRRAGLRPEAAADFARWLTRQPGVRLVGTMTHLASADDPDADPHTLDQLDAFQGALDAMRAQGIDPGVVHAANTAAAWRLPQARFDMVRMGLGLYGLNPSDAVGDVTRAHHTRAALRFTTRIIHLAQVEAGESVGYGRSWIAPERRRIATIAAGYNDGLPRFMSSGGEVLIGGRRCVVVGRVCMDVSMVDVTDLGEAVAVGDEVVIFGEQGEARLSVDEIARRGQTISYELLCHIAPRVRRIYVRHEA